MADHSEPAPPSYETQHSSTNQAIHAQPASEMDNHQIQPVVDHNNAAPIGATGEKAYYQAQDQQQAQQQQPIELQQQPQQGQVQQQAPSGVPGVYNTAVPLANLGATPAPVDCPNCKVRALTHVNYETGNTNMAWGIVACLICCCLAFIPCMMDSLKDVRHTCGNCGAGLALWHKSGRTDVLLHQ